MIVAQSNQYAKSVWVSGEPKGQPRARAASIYSKKQGRFMARMYDPGTAENWKGQVQLAFADKLPPAPLDGPISLVITFVFPRPKRLHRKKDPDGELWHTKKPDVDNSVKAVMDALTNIGMWHDDTQVAELTVRKVISEKQGRPGAAIDVVQLVPQEQAERDAMPPTSESSGARLRHEKGPGANGAKALGVTAQE